MRPCACAKKVRCIECNKWHLQSILLAKMDKNPQGNCGYIDIQIKKRLGLTYRHCDDFIPLSEKNKKMNRQFANQINIRVNPWREKWLDILLEVSQ